MSQFFFLQNTEVPVSKKEVIRYLGYRAKHQPDETVNGIIDSCIKEMHAIIRPALVYEEFDVLVDGGTCLVDGNEIKSSFLAKNFKDCNRVIMFASTIGSEVDKLIRVTNYSDTAKACVLQATGAMFIEEFVNLFNKKIEDEKKALGYKIHPRYSPGYGDLSLETQKLFFALLT